MLGYNLVMLFLSIYKFIGSLVLYLIDNGNKRTWCVRFNNHASLYYCT